jgi:putative transposase
MASNITKTTSSQCEALKAPQLFDDWFDPIESAVRDRAREFIEELIRSELDATLARPRYERSRKDAPEASGVTGHRHGRRTRSLTGSFGPIEITVPRARLDSPEGGTTEWRSQGLRAYQRRTLAADALIASTYLAGTNTRRVRRALATLFAGTIGKDTVSRTWRKVKSDWDAWNARSLADEPIVRLILDGTVVRVRLDRKATAISLLVVLGVREDGQKVLLAIKSMGGESAEAWRAVLDDLISRGLRRPEFLIVDGAPGLEKAIAAVWDGVPVQRCTVHKHRNLLAHAPERLHDEITADYTDMIYAATPEEIETKRKAFIRKWRLKHRAVADSLQKAGDRLFSFTRLPPSGRACAPPTPSSACRRSSSGGSRRGPCCHRHSDVVLGLCSLPVRSACVRSMAGKRSPPSSSISQLTSPRSQVASRCRKFRRANSNHIPGGTFF